MRPKFVYSDGGRKDAGFKGKAGDCAVRAICNATGKDYQEVYNKINLLAKDERITKRKRSRSSSREGVYKETVDKYLKSIGWKWITCMRIGQGIKVHVREGELPKGNSILRLSKHFSCSKDGVLYDTYDCSRDGTRGVYGYWVKEAEE